MLLSASSKKHFFTWLNPLTAITMSVTRHVRQHFYAFHGIAGTDCWSWYWHLALWVRHRALSITARDVAVQGLTAKNDIGAGSELITSELRRLNTDAENTPVYKNPSTTTWTVTGFFVLSANFPSFCCVEWKQCWAVLATKALHNIILPRKVSSFGEKALSCCLQFWAT